MANDKELIERLGPTVIDECAYMIGGGSEFGHGERIEMVTNIIRRAEEALTASGRVSIKPLEWGSNHVFAFSASMPWGAYFVAEGRDFDRGGEWYFALNGEECKWCKTANEAKDAAQADYERRILAALQPPQAGEREAETCKTCAGNGEVVTDWERYMHGPLDENGEDAVKACDDCEGTGTIPPSHEPDPMGTPHPASFSARALLDAKREAYEDAAKDVSGPAAWLERWAQHVGSCRGGGHCTCGLTLARAEINAIRAKAEGLGE